MSKHVRVREDHVLEVLNTDGMPDIEVRPGYREILGPYIEIHRVGIHGMTEYVCTIRLPAVSELVRKLPIVVAAARRLQNGAGGSGLARTPSGRRNPAK